jgi:capsular exopolysaccharide synthesis family protein
VLLEAGENWPEVKELNKQIIDLEDQLKQTRERAVGVVLANLETAYRQALDREQSLRKAFEQQHSQIMSQDASAIDYKMIQQETATYRGLLDSLLQRSKENEIILAATPNNVHVTDYATLPVAPTGPQRFRIVALAFAVSFAVGVALVVLLGALDDNVTVDSVQRVEKVFGLPALGVIPEANRRSLGSRLNLRRRNPNGHWLMLSDEIRSSLVDSDNKPNNGNGHKGLLLYQQPRSPFAESYKKLRTSVLFSTADRPPKTLLVTSSLPGEGKTTSVINMGFVMAQTGAKILLIDADLRHPSLHEILGIENECGLSTILSGNFNEADTLSMINQYQDSSLYILPAGPTPDNPAELLGSEQMRTLITTLHSTFSHIIIDSPPISFFTDAILVSALVEGVLMIVRGPKSPRQVVRYSLQSLDGVGAPILGIILNAVNVRTNDYSYYRNYYR